MSRDERSERIAKLVNAVNAKLESEVKVPGGLSEAVFWRVIRHLDTGLGAAIAHVMLHVVPPGMLAAAVEEMVDTAWLTGSIARGSVAWTLEGALVEWYEAYLPSEVADRVLQALLGRCGDEFLAALESWLGELPGGRSE